MIDASCSLMMEVDYPAEMVRLEFDQKLDFLPGSSYSQNSPLILAPGLWNFGISVIIWDHDYKMI